MESASNPTSPTKTCKIPFSPYFKSLTPLKPSQTDSSVNDPNIPTGLSFYKSVLIDKHVILLGKYANAKKNPSVLWSFDIESQIWGTFSVSGSSFLVENKEDYSVCITQDHQIVLFGSSAPISIGKEPNISPEYFIFHSLQTK